MALKDIRERDFTHELVFSTGKSSGPGGQNVNKVNTRVELRFKPFESEQLTREEKDMIGRRLHNKITAGGYIIISSQQERSQMKNKQHCIEKFFSILEKAVTKKKKRKPTSPTRASKEKRLEKKKIRSEKKYLRKKLNP